MTGPDVAVLVAGFVFLLVILDALVGPWVERHLLSSDEREDAYRRNHARRR